MKYFATNICFFRSLYICRLRYKSVFKNSWITHNFVIAWFVREVLGAPEWRWLGLNQANCGLTIIRVRSAKPAVLVTHNDLGHLPVELRTGMPDLQPF